jgi:hypothetical protein
MVKRLKVGSINYYNLNAIEPFGNFIGIFMGR